MVIRDDIGKSVFHDTANEAGYKRVLPGQFVIHLRSFQGGFAHSAVEGITSPAYTVFGFQQPEKHDDYFWKYVFSSKEFIKRLESVTYGIRDGRSISYNEFLTMSFVFPSVEEQHQISAFLLKLDHLIWRPQESCHFTQAKAGQSVRPLAISLIMLRTQKKRIMVISLPAINVIVGLRMQSFFLQKNDTSRKPGECAARMM